MDTELTQRLKYERKILADAREQYSQRWDLCKGYEAAGLKRIRRKSGKCYYCVKRPGSDKYTYLGSKNHPEVKLIRESRHVKEALKRIDHNIELLDSFSGRYYEYDNASVASSLASVYRDEVYPVSGAYQKTGEQWKTERLLFQKDFPENHPEHKTYRTSDGIMVKSLSEVLIYERLKDAGLFEVYELPLPMGDYGPPLYPDFSVLSPIDRKSVILVEYVGRMDLPGYRADFVNRVGRYIENGYIPGVNLFFIFGDKNGHIDSMQITKVLADIKGL